MNQGLSTYYTFYIVAKTGNISSASKELFISQPAVSKSIAKLEQSLNLRLFDRTSRGVSLTREGTILYNSLSEAFHAIEQGEEQLQYESQLGVGQLSIGVSTTLCKYLLLPFLKEFVRENPHIKISIACQPTFETLKSLENNEIDIGLVAKPSNLDNLIFKDIYQVDDIFVTTESYLQNLQIRTGSEITMQQLKNRRNTKALTSIFNNATLMLLDQENMTRQYIDRYLTAHDYQPKNLLEVSTMDLLIEFAKIDLGVACVIKNFVRKELEDGSLIEFPLPFQIKSRHVGFAWQNKQNMNPALQTFIEASNVFTYASN